ncbi:DUF6392 family protein [Pseudomonas sp. NPDC098747]|uniref:DUF6392 family protein n=1 Tax=Pseudomonas sp. NPDC098747 TaxID=3364487 RepID=UPI00383B4634
MKSTNLELLITKLGASHSNLISDGIVSNKPLERLYQDSDSLELEPEPGLELIFYSDTERFEAIQITLGNNMGEKLEIYKGELPEGYAIATNQSLVRAIFGTPFQTKGPMEIPGTDITIGAIDSYVLNPDLNGTAFVYFQYAPDLRVDRIEFSVFDRN